RSPGVELLRDPAREGRPRPAGQLRRARTQPARSRLGPMLAGLVRAADAGTITAEQLLEFSPFVAVQWMRTRTFRDTAYEAVTKAGQALADQVVQLNFGPEPKVRFSIGERGRAAIHIA